MVNSALLVIMRALRHVGRWRMGRVRVGRTLAQAVYVAMLGTLALYETTCRRLAVQGDCAVLSVDYRLAPETQFPGAVLDAYAATRWASHNAALLNIDPSRIAVGGDSAGGNLAAVVSQMAQDSKEFQVAL